MARKRRCENKSYLTAKGCSITFLGVAKSGKAEMLINAFEYPLHVERKGDDVVAYFHGDWYKDELEFLRRFYGKQLGEILVKPNIKVTQGVVLARHIPEILPLRDNRTWESVYEDYITSSDRDDDGTFKSGSQSTIGDDYDESCIPAVVKTYSVNEFRVNGHFN